MNDDEVVQTATFNIDNARLRSQVYSTVLPRFAIVWFIMTSAFVLVGMMFRGSVYPQSAGLFSLVFLTLAPLYFALVFSLSAVKAIRATFDRIRKIPGASLYRCHFRPTGVDYDNDAGLACSVPYSVIFRLTPEVSGILVSVDSGRFLWVPRASFATAEDFQKASQWCLSAQLAKNPSATRNMN